jgi:CheY-like chemotaxis protein
MKKKIMLVDDEQIFHFIHRKMIEGAGIDCEIQTAINGREALNIINGNITNRCGTPDIIFVDLNMPIMNGFEFIQTFRKLDIPNKEAVTIIILTSSILDVDTNTAASLGVKYFLTKPLSSEDVSKIVSAG